MREETYYCDKCGDEIEVDNTWQIWQMRLITEGTESGYDLCKKHATELKRWLSDGGNDGL